MKKFLCRIMAFALILILFSVCSYSVKAATTIPTASEQVSALEPELSKSNVMLVKGNSTTINILNVSNEERDLAEWESSNSKIVKVLQKGRLQAQNVGEATVVVKVAGKKLVCKVTVETLVTNYSNKVVSLVNEERRMRGLDVLKTDSMLTKAAQTRARELAEKSYLDHTRPDGKNYMSVFTEYSINHCGASENLARGQDNPVEVMKAWMSDSGKRAGILTSEYTHIGVGYYNKYWVQLFVKKK